MCAACGHKYPGVTHKKMVAVAKPVGRYRLKIWSVAPAPSKTTSEGTKETESTTGTSTDQEK